MQTLRRSYASCLGIQSTHAAAQVEQVAAESEAKALARASRESAATLKTQLAQQRAGFQAQQVGQQQQHSVSLSAPPPKSAGFLLFSFGKCTRDHVTHQHARCLGVTGQCVARVAPALWSRLGTHAEWLPRVRLSTGAAPGRQHLDM
jgi:hypothetical protein